MKTPWYAVKPEPRVSTSGTSCRHAMIFNGTAALIHNAFELPLLGNAPMASNGEAAVFCRINASARRMLARETAIWDTSPSTPNVQWKFSTRKISSSSAKST